jgi:type II secretory pathway component PulC
MAALNLLANKIKEGNLPDEMPTNMIIRYIRNTGVSNFNIENLVDLNEKNESLKNIIKSISKNRVVFATDGIKDDKSSENSSDGEGTSSPEKNVVSKMAKSALKRRT